MRVYQKAMTPLAFIEKWKGLFSPPTRSDMERLGARIDLGARKQAILFIAKLQRRVRQRKTPESPPRAPPRPPPQSATTKRRRRTPAYTGIGDDYVENPGRKFLTSLRH